MKRFIVEREIPGLGKLSQEELQAISQKSNSVLEEMDVPYHWVQSWVSDNKMYCMHIAPNAETVKEHAKRGGFPCDNVVEVTGSIDPTTTG